MMQNVISTALSAFFSLFAAFIIHRTLTWSALTPTTDLTAQAIVEAIAVGSMSDVWIAFLGSLIVLISGIFRLHRVTAYFLMISMAIAAAAHQAYVEYFHFQIMPFHLAYITDENFLRANGRSALQWTVWINLLTILALTKLMNKITVSLQKSSKKLGSIYTFLAIFAVFCHNRNIDLRMRWYVPENLQLNSLERLYVNAASARIPDPLSAEEATFLQQSIAPDTGSSSIEELFGAKSTRSLKLDDIGQAIHEIFVKSKIEGRKPIVIALLLESMRPSDTGYFTPDHPSLTPNLDKIAQSSITFVNAYSTGSVTRGAQEAVFCGYLGSRDTSLMRGRAIISPDCLPDLLFKQQKNVDSFWYHGGEAKFDSQAEFWKLHRVKEIISQTDFPESTPRTDWGVGDVGFLTEAARRIVKLKATMHGDAGLGMLLTVTNHIPWQLPEDAPKIIRDLHETADHPSRSTVAYADFALGKFVDSLRSEGIWQDTLIAFISDHGNSVPPHKNIYKDDPAKDFRMQSHINLILSGGIIDTVLDRKNLDQVTRTELVSQADVAGFFAYLFELDKIRFFGESLFLRKRRSPVISDLEQGLFYPNTGRFLSNREVIEIDPWQQPEPERLGILYFRSFLRLIMQQSATNN